MKGKVFGLIVVTSIGIGAMSYFGYLGKEDIVQVKVTYVKFSCDDDNIDMKVNAVSDSSFYYLIGKNISPEQTFKQKELNAFVKGKLEKDPAAKDFLVIGYIRQGPVLHCSGSLCFKVEKIKYEDENEFTEF